ncbi:MAG: Kelch repeat-containing protein, partial [Acidimicrobiales bacterium]
TATTGTTTATTAPAPAPQTWRTRASAPMARQEVAAAELDGKVWVVGGLTASDATARVESYDPGADRWARGPDLPITLHHLTVVAYRGELVVVGGFQGGGGGLYGGPTDRVLALRGGAWVDLPRLRRPRGAAGAAVVGDRIYLVGGRDNNLLIAPTEVFDGTSWQDRAPIPSPRDHLAVAADGRGVYAAAGRLLDPNAMTGAFERYDPGRDAWETLAAVPTPRGGLAASFLGTRLVTSGGESASRVFPQVEAYDTAANAWSALPNMPVPRHGHGGATAGGAVLTLVGATSAGVDPSAVTEALS